MHQTKILTACTLPIKCTTSYCVISTSYGVISTSLSIVLCCKHCVVSITYGVLSYDMVRCYKQTHVHTKSVS